MTVISREGDTFTLEYDLFSLPTAQHKAGLAGLMLMIDSLEARKIEPKPIIESLRPDGARISFTLPAIQTVFNDLYDSEWVEVASKQIWKDNKGKKKDPKRVEEASIEVDGKLKVEKKFIYDDVRPKGTFLQEYYPDGNGLYVKLWRDMLWDTLRAIPTTRNDYKERAKGQNSALAAEFWGKFERAFVGQEKGRILAEGLASSLFIGAENSNAEKVPFKGPVVDSFLLHFWPIVSLIYVPHTWGLERNKDGGARVTHKQAGFVFSVPEPVDLALFCEDGKAVLRGLNPEGTGIRPRSSIIDLHEEGGLEYLYHFAQRRALEAEDYTLSLCALEVFHLEREKNGKRIRLLAAERLLPRTEVIKEYELLRKDLRNPIFKERILRNLLDGNSWHAHFEQAFHQHPLPLFISCQGKTPQGMPVFGSDVSRKFRGIETELKNDKEGGYMDEQTRDNELAMRIYRLIQTYVNLRTEEKSGKKYKDFSEHRDAKGRIRYPQEYRDAREKVCSDAFLAMRGRREQDFVEYFTGTICSVPQYLPQQEYAAVAGALMSDWEKIKTLAMLALSAHSYLSENNKSMEVE